MPGIIGSLLRGLREPRPFVEPHVALPRAMRVVMAPVNISGQPITLVEELRSRGVDIRLLQYTGITGGHKFGYQVDEAIPYDGKTRDAVQIDTIERCLREGVDIFHFWLRSMWFNGIYDGFTGFDIPIIRGYGRKVFYRFTGEDLRIKSIHEAKNPYNAHRYGYVTKIDEAKQRPYLDFVMEQADQLIVQDPELKEFCPQAAVVPRSLNLDRFPYVGPISRDRPLVIHAPSAPTIKGTPFVQAAIEQLREEGLSFDYQEVTDLSHEEALALYRRADIVVDQLHIGWYGVLAAEAMALGKTVICYVRQDLQEGFEPAIPYVHANPDTITDVLRATIRDADLREEMGPKARHFVEQVHDARKVGDKLLALYNSHYTGPAEPREEFATLRYFADQAMRTNAELATGRSNSVKAERLRAEVLELRPKARKYDESSEAIEATAARKRARKLES